MSNTLDDIVSKLDMGVRNENWGAVKSALNDLEDYAKTISPPRYSVGQQVKVHNVLIVNIRRSDMVCNCALAGTKACDSCANKLSALQNYASLFNATFRPDSQKLDRIIELLEKLAKKEE